MVRTVRSSVMSDADVRGPLSLTVRGSCLMKYNGEIAVPSGSSDFSKEDLDFLWFGRNLTSSCYTYDTL